MQHPCSCQLGRKSSHFIANMVSITVFDPILLHSHHASRVSGLRGDFMLLWPRPTSIRGNTPCTRMLVYAHEPSTPSPPRIWRGVVQRFHTRKRRDVYWFYMEYLAAFGHAVVCHTIPVTRRRPHALQRRKWWLFNDAKGGIEFFGGLKRQLDKVLAGSFRVHYWFFAEAPSYATSAGYAIPPPGFEWVFGVNIQTICRYITSAHTMRVVCQGYGCSSDDLPRNECWHGDHDWVIFSSYHLR